jgi:hypothetical protein
MLASTFRQRYDDPKLDPYDGSYQDVLAEFVVPSKNWTCDELASRTVDMQPDAVNAYVGLFGDDLCRTGTTRLIHAPRRFPAKLGKTTVHDDECFALLDDIVRGSIQVVHYRKAFFEPTTKIWIPTNMDTVLSQWKDNPDLDLLPTPKTNREGIRVTKMMFVPARYTSLFMGRRLTPRQLIEDIYPILVADDQDQDMKPFIQWMVACGMSEADKSESPVMQADVTSPIADQPLLNWIQDFVERSLGMPARPPTTSTEALQPQMASMLAQIIQGQQQQQEDVAIARALAKTPRTVSEHFKIDTTNRLMILCDVVVESDLPEVWINLANNGGKRDRQTIEMVFRDKATDSRMWNLVPIVTPNLAKKIVEMRFVGNNLDDLDEGISPFSVVLIDNTTRATETAYQTAIKAARNYDDLTKGVSVPLIELNTVHCVKTVIPRTFTAAKAMLKAFLIVMVSILGEQHALINKYNHFLEDLDAKESFYSERIQKYDPILGPARLLRFVQLHTRAWFLRVQETSDHAEARAVKLPPYHKPGEKMVVNSMSWLPDMPHTGPKQNSLTPGHPGDRENEKKRGNPGDSSSIWTQVNRNDEGKRPKLTVVNPQKNKIFEDFNTKIENTRFNTAIAKVGPPPPIQRDNRQVNMCASYHLRGNCSTTCTRAIDHAPHSTEEDQQLYNWCTKAFS